MDTLELGKDIEFVRFNTETAEYHFQILDQDAVRRFLSNAKLMKFLMDPVTPSEPATSGCRITFDITSKEGELIISRKTNLHSFKWAVMRDLLMTMNSYVMPTAAENCYPQWADMVADFFLDSPIPRKTLPRGEELLSEPLAVPTATR